MQLAGLLTTENAESTEVFLGGGRFRGRGFWCGAQLFLAGLELLITLMALMFFWGLVVAVSFVPRLPAGAVFFLWGGFFVVVRRFGADPLLRWVGEINLTRKGASDKLLL